MEKTNTDTFKYIENTSVEYKVESNLEELIQQKKIKNDE